MPKYLWEVSSTTEGAKGTIKDGGTKRWEAAAKALASVGGKLEACYAFGDRDVISITDLPDNASVAAASLAISASGAATVRTPVLLSREEIDTATRRKLSYRAPGK